MLGRTRNKEKSKSDLKRWGLVISFFSNIPVVFWRLKFVGVAAIAAIAALLSRFSVGSFSFDHNRS